jgi:hypothetical protein
MARSSSAKLLPVRVVLLEGILFPTRAKRKHSLAGEQLKTA